MSQWFRGSLALKLVEFSSARPAAHLTLTFPLDDTLIFSFIIYVCARSFEHYTHPTAGMCDPQSVPLGAEPGAMNGDEPRWEP